MTGHMLFIKKQLLYVSIMLCAQPALWAAGDENQNMMPAETPAASSQRMSAGVVPPPTMRVEEPVPSPMPQTKRLVGMPKARVAAGIKVSPQSPCSSSDVVESDHAPSSEDEIEQKSCPEHSIEQANPLKSPERRSDTEYQIHLSCPVASEFIDHLTFFRSCLPIRLYVVYEFERSETMKLPRLNMVGFILDTFGVAYNIRKPKKRIVKSRVVYIGNLKCVLQEYEELPAP